MDAEAAKSADETKIVPACPKACNACPWRLANEGKPHPHKFYASANLARLWKALRRGGRMSCHPTDPRMAEFEGYEDTADRDETHECAGALTIVQREFSLFQALSKEDPKANALAAYRRLRPGGVTREGLISVMERAIFSGTALGGVRMTLPDLGDEAIGYSKLPWTPELAARAFKGG
ncbi:MAG TPA: hypothetical protein VF183_07360 [Acidimicrobiales bacterium]